MSGGQGDSGDSRPADVDGPNYEEISLRLFELSDSRAQARIAFEVVIHCMREAVLPPEWARATVVKAFELFEVYEVECLGEALGFEHTTRAQAKRTRLDMAAVAYEVRHFQDAGHPLNSSRDKDGALDLVAKRRCMSVGQVKKLKGEWESLCKRTGSDPYGRLETMNPKSLIFQLIADSLGGVKPNNKAEE